MSLPDMDVWETALKMNSNELDAFSSLLTSTFLPPNIVEALNEPLTLGGEKADDLVRVLGLVGPQSNVAAGADCLPPATQSPFLPPAPRQVVAPPPPAPKPVTPPQSEAEAESVDSADDDKDDKDREIDHELVNSLPPPDVSQWENHAYTTEKEYESLIERSFDEKVLLLPRPEFNCYDTKHAVRKTLFVSQTNPNSVKEAKKALTSYRRRLSGRDRARNRRANAANAKTGASPKPRPPKKSTAGPPKAGKVTRTAVKSGSASSSPEDTSVSSKTKRWIKLQNVLALVIALKKVNPNTRLA
mmetsp:Transcript_8899/g.12501  ORF Transcript_8899/g.12501 Transcript_8899/m.12501 type:complete len:301 (+) Transcript_8899:168-1070(+)